MAILPKYQKTGIKVRQPSRMDFAASREATRLGQAISTQLDRMGEFAFKEAAREAEQRGQERVRQEGAIPVLEQLQAQDGPRTIAERSAFEAANRVAIVEIETAARSDMRTLIAEADENNMAMNVFNQKMSDIQDGYTASLQVVDPTAAGVLNARLQEDSVSFGTRYSEIVTRKARAAWAANTETILTSQVEAIQEAALQEGTTEESIRKQGEKLLETAQIRGVNQKKAQKLVDKAVNTAIRENLAYRLENAAGITEKQAILAEIEKTEKFPGLNFEQTRSLEKRISDSINNEINIERRKFEDTLNDAIEVMIFTGETRPGFEFDEDKLSELYESDELEILRGAWDDAQEDVLNQGSLASMSPNRIAEVKDQLFAEISTAADPEKAANRYNSWVQSVQRRESEMQKDAALFIVQTNENAASAVENIQTQLSAGNIGIAAQGIVVLNDIVQSQYDLMRAPQGQRKIMPKGMAAGIVDAIQSIDTGVASQYFQQIQDELGDLAPQFLEELRAAKLRPEYVEAMYQPNKPGLQKELLDLSDREVKEIKVGLETADTNLALKEINSLTEDYRRAFLAGGGSKAEDIFNEQLAIAEKLAYSRLKDGKITAAKAAESAVRDIFTEFENVVLDKNGRYIVPSTFDLSQIQRLSESLLSETKLREMDVAPLDAIQYPGYVDEAISFASLASDGLWLNNSTADGLILHYNINGYPLPVLTSDGDPFEVKFADLPAILDGFKTSRRKGRK